MASMETFDFGHAMRIAAQGEKVCPVGVHDWYITNASAMEDMCVLTKFCREYTGSYTKSPDLQFLKDRQYQMWKLFKKEPTAKDLLDEAIDEMNDLIITRNPFVSRTAEDVRLGHIRYKLGCVQDKLNKE